LNAKPLGFGRKEREPQEECDLWRPNGKEEKVAYFSKKVHWNGGAKKKTKGKERLGGHQKGLRKGTLSEIYSIK